MKINAIIKIICIIVITSLAVFLNNVYSLLIITLFSLILLSLLRVNIADFYNKSKHYLKLIVIIAVLDSIFIKKGDALIHIKDFKIITDYGVVQGVEFICRSVIIISSALIMGTSDIGEMTTALTDMKIPYSVAFLTTVAFSTLPKLKNEFVMRLEAIELRGITIKDLKFKQKLEIYSYLIAPTIQSLIIKSNKLADYLFVKGFDTSNKRTHSERLFLCKQTLKC
jgi:energy-coupling factor transport system permease protein